MTHDDVTKLKARAGDMAKPELLTELRNLADAHTVALDQIAEHESHREALGEKTRNALADRDDARRTCSALQDALDHYRAAK